MSRKTTLDALFGKTFNAVDQPLETKAAPSPASAPTPSELTAVNSAGETRIRSGAIGAMGASLQHLQDSAREAEALRQSLLAAESIVLLDPTLIDSAPIADRFVIEHDAAERDLTASISESGQQVPVLVRPHPSKPGRWQAAYGHRRIRACRSLGQPVKAIVRPLTDTALAIAQGKENLERRDLSFIERVFFAAGLEDAGFDRHIVMQALGVHKADVSRYISLARTVPVSLVHLIGPAPKAGRARWMELADKLEPSSVADLQAILPQLSAFQAGDSDARFRFVLDRLSAAATPQTAATKAPAATVLRDAQGQPVATLKTQGRQQMIAVDEQAAPGFAAHVAAALPALYREWQSALGQSAKATSPETH
jgi:ParB family transcriptional regulator, chromosome partitioning protein